MDGPQGTGNKADAACLDFLKRSGGPRCGPSQGGPTCGDRVATFILCEPAPLSHNLVLPAGWNPIPHPHPMYHTHTLWGCGLPAALHPAPGLPGQQKPAESAPTALPGAG